MARGGLAIPLTGFARVLAIATYFATSTGLTGSDCRGPALRGGTCILLGLIWAGILRGFERVEHPENLLE